MNLNVKYQESYSRGELLLRAFFGFIYIAIPHYFILFFLNIWSSILTFIAFWVVLFTGRYPQSFFEFQVKVIRWSLRVQARLSHLSDGFPPFGLDVEEEETKLDVTYPERLSRGHLLVRAFFGAIYCAFPHYFVLFFRNILSAIFSFVAFWVVLFTGRYPQSLHEFNVGTIRWSIRVSMYLGFLTDEYPRFSGKP
ncbi:MAG: DUF4389 domain-containing protein [Chitinophagaceae bacterium]|nr:MAG: DUF4389 domain-containing protein [Chitinophagaceae bacterium]